MRNVIRHFLLAALLNVSGFALAQDFAFVGRKPDFAGAKKLEVAKGANPGVPLVFDTSTVGVVILRPAGPDEVSTSVRSTYRFERLEDGSLLFFEIVAPGVLKELDEANAADTASREGSQYEEQVIARFFDEGKVLQVCVPRSSPVRGTLTVYVAIDSTGRPKSALVLPEGSVAQCVVNATRAREYGVPPKEFVAKATIAITP